MWNFSSKNGGLSFLLVLLFAGFCIEAFSIHPLPTTNSARTLLSPNDYSPSGTSIVGTSLSLASGGSAAVNTETEVELTEKEEQVYQFLEGLKDSGLSFRIVVVGKSGGAILESTHTLGPYMAVSRSPKSGAHLVTFASDDKSFELHVQLQQVQRVALVERPGAAGRTMRILRLMGDADESICSLIVSQDNEAAAGWFGSLKEKYGDDWQIDVR